MPTAVRRSHLLVAMLIAAAALVAAFSHPTGAKAWSFGASNPTTLAAATSPALAASTADGTSNTIQVAVTSVTPDLAHHRVIVTAPAGGLTPGMRLASVDLVTPKLTYVFTDVMVESLVGHPSADLSLNFTKIEAFPSRPCRPGVDACLMETEGIYASNDLQTGGASYDLAAADKA